MQTLPEKKRIRNSYDISIKIATQLNCLPLEVARSIPKSTLSTFKTTDYSHVIRLTSAEDYQEMVNLFIRVSKLENLVKLLKDYIRVKDTIISIYSKIKVIKPYLKYYKEKIISTILKVKDTFPLDRVCKYFKISKSRFYSWLYQVNHSCPSSSLKKCRHRWSNQISQKEESLIVKQLNNPFYKGWAIYQIAVHSLLNNIISVSVSTWYKYIKILKLHLPKIKKKKQLTGIRAAGPNEIWHMDVTIYKTTDNITAYIYVLLDNFTRFILDWKIATYLSGKISLAMVRESYKKYLVPVSVNNRETKLLVDGGPENNNSGINEFLNDDLVPIRKLIAQKDIKFSNSMVEAFNKTLKYRHLFPHNISDYKSLVNHLNKCIPEYNKIRTHYAHKYHTPAQVYFGEAIDVNKIKNQFEIARKKRIIENKNVNCPLCTT